MALNPQLQALAVPAGTQFAGTLAGLLAQIGQFMEVGGLEDFNGLVFSATTPAAEDRDKPWLKLDGSGNPLGIYAWNGADWIAFPLVLTRGATGDRPTTPVEGQKFLDTSINAELTYERGAWRTSAGTPGDIKFVAKTTLADALAANPGWIEFVNARGRVIGASGVSAEVGISARTYLELAGEETHALTTAELATHAHGITFAKGTAAGAGFGADAGLYGKAASAGAGGTEALAPDAGDGDAHENMQPTIFTWCLLKE